MSVIIDHNTFKEDFIDVFGSTYSYVIRAIENNNHKKLPFLKYLSSQGFIPVGSEDNLYEMIKIFEQKFQGNQDLAFEINKNLEFSPYFKILYPEVEVINTRREKHTIKNLVVVFSLKWCEEFNKWQIGEMTGLRLTLSYLEAVRQYGHSHLQSTLTLIKQDFKSMTSSKFCLGSSTLGMSISEYNTEGDNEKSNLILEGILYTLDTYVTWESLEGVPYNYIRNLIPLGGSLVSEYSLDHHTDRVVNYLKVQKIPLDLEYGIINNSIFIKKSFKNIEFFKNILRFSSITARSTLEKEYLCFPSNSGETETFLQVNSNFYTKEDIKREAMVYKSNNLAGMERVFTFFNGRKYPLVFSSYMEKKIEKDEQNIIIYPKFLNNVYRKLELEIQRARLRSKAVKHLTTIRSAKRGTRQDQITL